MKAVAVWPHDELANLNAANIMLKRGELDAAEVYLRDAGLSAEAAYTRGSLAARRGDLDVAINYMKQAAERNLPGAAAELERLQTLRSTPSVTYLLPEEIVTGTPAE